MVYPTQRKFNVYSGSIDLRSNWAGAASTASPKRGRHAREVLRSFILSVGKIVDWKSVPSKSPR